MIDLVVLAEPREKISYIQLSTRNFRNTVAFSSEKETDNA
jgi:hypothetical protein